MAIIAIILYGSVARGDQTATSDLDMLAIVTERPRQKFDKLQTNITFYNAFDMIKAAERGDLFALHLLLEAKFVYDDEGFEKQFREKFCRRQSYREEILKASAVGWFLAQRHKEINNNKLLNRRVAWCVRTILIAKSVEADAPRFSAEGLFKMFKSQESQQLMALKNSDQPNLLLRANLEHFLKTFGDDVHEIKNASFMKQKEIFESTNNKVAQQIIADFIKHQHLSY